MPADPAVACPALERRGREHRKGKPPVAVTGDVAHGLADGPDRRGSGAPASARGSAPRPLPRRCRPMPPKDPRPCPRNQIAGTTQAGGGGVRIQGQLHVTLGKSGGDQLVLGRRRRADGAVAERNVRERLLHIVGSRSNGATRSSEFMRAVMFRERRAHLGQTPAQPKRLLHRDRLAPGDQVPANLVETSGLETYRDRPVFVHL